ncbi:MAG: hypothetical protein ACUVRD_01985 [Bacteroidia bacterium]
MRNVIGIFLISVGARVYAQFPPRTDDHFWRKKVVLTVDLREKLNRLITEGQTDYRLGDNYSQDPITDKAHERYPNREGMIATLLANYKSGKYLAFNPVKLNQNLSYEEFSAKMRKYVQETPIEDSGDEFGAGGEEMSDEFGGDLGEEDDFGTAMDEAPATDAPSSSAAAKRDPLYKYVSTKFRIIEDRIFDKNKSDMYYDIQYICLVYVDPKGAQPDEDIVCFRYKDVMDVLDDTQWRNRYNDAEDRSMREIIELRRFQGFVTVLSGETIMSLNEAELRRQQMIEFEHHLWTF